MSDIVTLATLENVIDRTSPQVPFKVICHLDETALHWIARSPLLFAGFGEGGAEAITLGGGAPASHTCPF